MTARRCYVENCNEPATHYVGTYPEHWRCEAHFASYNTPTRELPPRWAPGLYSYTNEKLPAGAQRLATELAAVNGVVLLTTTPERAKLAAEVIHGAVEGAIALEREARTVTEADDYRAIVAALRGLAEALGKR